MDSKSYLSLSFSTMYLIPSAPTLEASRIIWPSLMAGVVDSKMAWANLASLSGFQLEPRLGPENGQIFSIKYCLHQVHQNPLKKLSLNSRTFTLNFSRLYLILKRFQTSSKTNAT